MKNYLHTLPYFLLFFLLASITSKSYGQCTCSGGAPATPLTYYSVLDTTDAPSSTISFPKFNPTMGILSCIRFRDTLSLISTSDVTNTASVDVIYRFLLSVTNDISGPGISVNESATRNYGPTLLTQAGDPADRTVYGPDTLFQNSTHSNSSSSIASYLGSTGNVDFIYTVNGGLIATQGGLNYTYQIVSKYWGAFSLTYYWCPNIVLATNIKNFSAYKKENAVLLKWVTENKTPGTTYEVEYSIDGTNFTGAGQTNTAGSIGNSTQHEFQYIPGASGSKKLYFRIKETDAQGKVTYSAIRSVDMNENAAAGFIIYPNPIQRKVSMQFDRSLNGNYVVEVTNLSGQIIYNRNMKLNNTNNVQFDLPNPPSSGMYYLKLTDSKSKLSYSNKLIIRR
ncbi:MAG: choice-of-anchor E domain-containing protein [Chitinophagaceae bacterium]|nr:choice-of-anchor E domain-containing protein [Chitinophagaceae bacterium]